MTRTGWGEDPDGAPALPVTAMLLGRQERRAGVVETALARSRAADAREAREEAARAPDPDERAANFLADGYQPGLLFELSQRLGDVQAELEAEREKLDKGARRAERLARDHAAGRIGALDALRMQDFDGGDSYRCEQLERRAEGIRQQLTAAQAAITPPRARDLDPLEQASRHAHDVFAETTRAMLAGERPVPSAPRPFASRASAGAGDSTEHTGADCWVCAAGRQRDAERAAGAAGERKLPPPTEFNGPSLTRAVGEDDDGRIGNYAPMIYR